MVYDTTDDESVEMPTTDAQNDVVNKMWAQAGVDFMPCQKAVEELPPGQYVIRYSDQRGCYFSKKEVNLDDLIDLPDSATESVLSTIQDFWGREEYFREFGFLWKRGIV